MTDIAFKHLTVAEQEEIIFGDRQHHEVLKLFYKSGYYEGIQLLLLNYQLNFKFQIQYIFNWFCVSEGHLELAKIIFNLFPSLKITQTMLDKCCQKDIANWLLSINPKLVLLKKK